MSEQELHLRADSAVPHFTASPLMKKLSKRTADKQTAEQPAENNDQLSVQMLISSKMSKKLAQFFADESDKTSDSFKIKLEALIFKSEPELLSKKSVHEVNFENKDKISDEIKKILKIIKK